MIKVLLLFFLVAPAFSQRILLDGGVSGGTLGNLGGAQIIRIGSAQPQIIRTVAAQPQIIRTVAAQPQIIRTVAAQPQIFRTVQPSRSIIRNEVVQDEAPKPYAFSYGTDDEAGTRTSREEQSDGNAVRGSYSYTDPDGVYRTVEYIADADGYRATVKTNEPGTAKSDIDPADTIFEVEEPPQGIYERYTSLRTVAQPQVLRQPNIQILRQPQPQISVIQPQLQNIAIRRRNIGYRLVPVEEGDSSVGGGNIIYLNSLRGRRA